MEEETLDRDNLASPRYLEVNNYTAPNDVQITIESDEQATRSKVGEQFAIIRRRHPAREAAARLNAPDGSVRLSRLLLTQRPSGWISLSEVHRTTWIYSEVESNLTLYNSTSWSHVRTPEALLRLDEFTWRAQLVNVMGQGGDELEKKVSEYAKKNILHALLIASNNDYIHAVS